MTYIPNAGGGISDGDKAPATVTTSFWGCVS